jgi:carbamoyl-phosphate synthase large subunit
LVVAAQRLGKGSEMTTRVLVTGAGGPAAVSFMHAIELGREPLEIFAVDADPYAPGLYLVPFARRALVPLGKAPDFVERLLGLCKRYKIDVLVPTVDAELVPIAIARDSFEREGIRVMLAGLNTLSQCLDKAELMTRCHPVVAIPETHLFDESFHAKVYPYLVKPRTGSGGRGIEIVRTPKEAAALARSSKLIAQEYLSGEEYSVDVLCNNKSELVAAVPRVRLRIDSGVAVSCVTTHAKDLIVNAGRVAERIGLVGVANVQFRRDDAGIPKLMEVNPRFPGSMPLTVAAGVNMPLLWLEEVLGKPMPKGPMPFREVALARTYADQVVPAKEMLALTQRLHSIPASDLALAAFVPR